jgi:SAM-dependent methyltransferase
VHTAKSDVAAFWNEASCGEQLLLPNTEREGYRSQSASRYRLEPYIPGFAGFEAARGLEVLEIGVGLGADHQSFAEGGARLTGVDLTPRAIEHTRRRLELFGLTSELRQGDAEQLPFADGSFDVVYSWGVLHHSPDTKAAFREVHRVLRPGGQARIMVYSKWSLIGLMLWLRYGLLALKPWRGLGEIYAEHLESPGTKAYTEAEARELCAPFAETRIRTVLTHGDLLESDAGQRHRGRLLSIARRIWPRWFFRRVTPRAGLYMLIECRKGS